MPEKTECFVLTVFDADRDVDIVVAVTTDVHLAVSWATEVVGGDFLIRPLASDITALMAAAECGSKHRAR